MKLVDFQVYDAGPTRRYVGVSRQASGPHEFVAGLDWGSFTNRWQQLSGQGLRLKRVIAYPNAIELPEPEWSKIFQGALGTPAEGYAYAVARKGTIVASAGVNKARSSNDPPATPWTPDVRINLASVSKAVTAVAVLKLFGDKKLSVDDHFYTIPRGLVPERGARGGHGDRPQPADDEERDGRRRLALHGRRACVPGDLPPAGARRHARQTYAYSNTNFTILQALIEQLSGTDYVSYVTQKVLVPMGINPAVFNPVPDPIASSTLSYSSGSDPDHGVYWPPIQAVAAGGWITSAHELLKFLEGVRSNAVLPAATTLAMLNGDLGWYTYDGLYGQYFHHNGGLLNGATPAQGLGTGIIHLADGYDALLLINSWGFDVIGLLVEAFEIPDVTAPGLILRTSGSRPSRRPSSPTRGRRCRPSSSWPRSRRRAGRGARPGWR